MNLCANLKLALGRFFGVAGAFGGHATLTDGLVSYWALDEASGVRYDSVVASANDLTDNNTVGSAAGMRNLAASFVSGSNEYLSLGSGITALDDQFTVAVWVYSGAVVALNGFLFNGSSGADMGLAFEQNVVGGGDMIVYVPASAADTTTYGYTATGIFQLNTWHLVVVTYDGTQAASADRLRVYIDNVDRALTRNGTHPASVRVGGAFWLGRAHDTTTYNTGRKDECGIWSRVLTAQERADLWNSGAGLFYGS